MCLSLSSKHEEAEKVQNKKRGNQFKLQARGKFQEKLSNKNKGINEKSQAKLGARQRAASGNYSESVTSNTLNVKRWQGSGVWQGNGSRIGAKILRVMRDRRQLRRGAQNT